MRSDTSIHDASPRIALDGEVAGVLAVDREDGRGEAALRRFVPLLENLQKLSGIAPSQFARLKGR